MTQLACRYCAAAISSDVDFAMFGGKNGAGVYQAIINLIPPHDTYIEPFLGSGAVMRRKAPALRSIGIDLNSEALDEFEYGYPGALYHCDAIDFLRSFVPRDRTVIYCDPPYVHSTRTGHDRYKYEMTDDDHRRLLETLHFFRFTSCNVLISGYRNDLYEDHLFDWWSVNFQAMTRGGVRTETIWMNFQPGEVHYHTYAGKDFTDRQRIKRKAERWSANYRKLPPAERQAVLAAILSTDI